MRVGFVSSGGFVSVFSGVAARSGQVCHNGGLRSRTTVRATTAMPAVSDDTQVAVKRCSVLIPEKLSPEGLSILREQHDVVEMLDLTPDQLLQEIPKHDGLIVRSATKVTKDVLEAASKLKVVGRAGVGVDNIDLTVASERGVLVVNAPTGNCVAAAEHAVALMCSLSRNVAAADACLKGGDWGRSKFVGASLVGKTLGVVGLGRIGREMARRAQGLGMKILAHDPYMAEEAAISLGISLFSLEDMLAKSDFVTLHIPLMDSTRDLIGEKELALMKPGARIINAARGGIITEPALLAALDSGHIAGAALDCFSSEPPHKSPDSDSFKLACHPKVVATPHLGASTVEAQLDVAIEIARAVSNALQGEMVPTMVNAPSIAPEVASKLRPRADLANKLGRLVYYLAGESLKAGEVKVTYLLADENEDTRLLRAAVIQGLMERGVDVPINIVNANSVAQGHGIQFTEVTELAEPGEESSITVEIKGTASVSGTVVAGAPHVTRIGEYVMDLPMSGNIMMYAQVDRPGQLGLVGSALGQAGINISDMTLARGTGSKAMVMLRLDSVPNESIVKEVDGLIGDEELHPLVIQL